MTWFCSHPTLRACNSPTCNIISNEFFAFLGSYIFISDQKVKAKSNRIEIAFFFIPLVIPRVAHWIIYFMLHISCNFLFILCFTYLITSPTNWYLYRWVSWNIPEVIDEKSTNAFSYWNHINVVQLIFSSDLTPTHMSLFSDRLIIFEAYQFKEIRHFEITE